MSEDSKPRTVSLFGITTPLDVLKGVLSGDMESFLRLADIHQRAIDADRQRAGAAISAQSDQVEQLAAALAAAQGKFSEIPRRKTATVPLKDKETGKRIGEYSYNYADLADIISAVRGPLAEQGLAVSQTLGIESYANERLLAVCTTHLRHSSGQWLRSVLKFPTGEKKIQELGSTFTYLRRYSLGAVLGIAPEEDDDAQLASQAEARTKAQERREAKAGKDAGEMPNEEQLAEFWASWKELAAPRFASKDQATAWLKDLDPNPNKANLGKLRSIINRLKLLKPLDGQADQAPKNGQVDKKPAKGKDVKKLTPEEQRRQAIQSRCRWSILVADKFKGIADKDLATATACWWAAEHYGWKRDPETEEQDGQIVPTRPKATLSAVEDIQRAVDGLKDLAADELEEMVRDYLGWTHDRMLELNTPAEGAQ